MGSKPVVSPSPSQWLMVEDEFDVFRVRHFETLFALANGYAGVRGSIEPCPLLGDAGFYVAGVFDNTPGGTYEIVNLPCWLGIAANMDGFDFDLGKGEVIKYRRALDMHQGILLADIVWRDGAKRRTRWESARLLHMKRKHAALLWGRITALDYSGTARLTGTMDAWAVKYLSASGLNHFAGTEAGDVGEQGIAVRTTMAGTGIEVAAASRLRVAADAKRSVRIFEDKVEETFAFALPEGRPVEFRKDVAFFTSRDGASPKKAARDELAGLAKVSVKRLVGEHTRAWDKVWQDADVRIEGDARAQKAIRFNVFHLASLGNPDDDQVSLAAKGLHGNGYRGMVFWDTEIYLVPFFTFTRPEAAEALLRYRYHHLPEARENARDAGCDGARFPWNSSITGREAGFRGFGWQDHLQADLAYAVDQYCAATGDREFYLSCGAQLIVETAMFWASRLSFDEQKQQYVMLNTCGTDETHGGINNNALTNHLAAWNLRRAVQAVGDLKKAGKWRGLSATLHVSDEDVAHWDEIGSKVYMPFDKRRGYHEQFDGYFRLKEAKRDPRMTQMMHTGPVLATQKPTRLLKQADTILLYYLFGDDFAKKARRAAFRFYEPRTTHASSLSRSIYAAEAARLGLMKDAQELFTFASELDFGEQGECDSGIHTASLGGAWQAAVMGFGGLRIRDGLPAFEPHVPKGWKRVRYRVKWRGRTLEVAATPTAIRLRTLAGSVQARVGDEVHRIGTRAGTFSLARRRS